MGRQSTPFAGEEACRQRVVLPAAAWPEERRDLCEVPHFAYALIDCAAALGYDALAIALHDRQFDVRPLAPYAAERDPVSICEAIAAGRVRVVSRPLRWSTSRQESDASWDALRERVMPHGRMTATCFVFRA